MYVFYFTENGTPYVINNEDGQHQQGPNSSNGQCGPGPSQNGYPALIPSQHKPTEQSTEQAVVPPKLSPYTYINYSIQGT